MTNTTAWRSKYRHLEVDSDCGLAEIPPACMYGYASMQSGVVGGAQKVDHNLGIWPNEEIRVRALLAVSDMTLVHPTIPNAAMDCSDNLRGRVADRSQIGI